MARASCWLGFLLGLTLHLASAAQIPLVPHLDPAPTPSQARKLKGRFLHITDIHPDPFYKLHSDPDQSCHHGTGPAGQYGAQKTECDSPYALVNATFDWIDKNLKNDIDFIVWTGDSARHDNDESFPRTDKQVIDQNSFLMDRMRQVFGKSGNNHRDPFTIPIVPTFGNNDILPHNLFSPGPNKWTLRFARLWKDLIPEAQKHQFERAGWFYVEVIPGKLAVFSLNTMYFFGNNAIVDGCKAKSEPGFEHFEWLRIQLEFLRQRGMKAIISGHVPPARNEQKIQWDETCWQKYALWMRQYRDVVVGSLWGHMNIEHFFLQDFEDIKKKTLHGRHVDDSSERRRTVDSANDDVSVMVKPPAYLTSLRDQWAALPKEPKHAFSDEISPESKKSQADKRAKYHDEIGGEWGERFSASFVSASVVPNFFPTLRVLEYNISGLEDAVVGLASDPSLSAIAPADEGEVDTSTKKHKKKKKKPKKSRFTVPAPPSKTSPPGPAYSPQTLTWTGYQQLYANLTHIHNEGEPESELDSGAETKGKKKGPRPFAFEVEYDTRNASDVYELAREGLTVRSLLRLAGRIGRYRPDKGDQMLSAELPPAEDAEDDDDGDDGDSISTDGKKKHKHKHKHKRRRIINRTWYAFVDRAVVRTLSREQLHEQFGEVFDGDDE